MTTAETKPIICGTDFSESAMQAATVADAPLILARSPRPALVVRPPLR